jgi:crotonobetainyl-CoA:carnitine CoA-transferase CaiB-like acyl-CoA transferase
MTTAARPLDGVRVLELARSQTGLRGGMILSDLLAEVIKIEPPVEEICAALGEAGVPVGPVRTIPEVARDPHLWDRQMLVKMDDPVAGEMYWPGVASRCRRHRAGSVRCRHPASTSTRSSRACSATTRARSVTCEAPARSRRLARAVPLTPVV